MWRNNEPPQNYEAERAVLGCIVIRNECLHMVRAMLPSGAKEFFAAPHRKVYTVMLELAENGKAIDPITVVDALTENGWLDEVGGPVSLSDMIHTVPTSANVEHYAEIVHDAYLLRSIIEVGQRVQTEAYAHSRSPMELVSKAVKTLQEISVSNPSRSAETLDKIRPAYEEHLDAVRSGRVPMLLTGINQVDHRLKPGGGLYQRMLCIGANPSHGKTSMAITIAYNLARQGIPVLIQSSESTRYEFLGRLDNHAIPEEEYAATRLKCGHSWQPMRECIAKYQRYVTELPIIIDDSSADIDTRIAATYAAVAQHGVQVVIWDYLQEFHVNMRGTPTQEEQIRTMVRKLNAARRDLGVCFIVTSQFRKGNYSDEHPPSKQDLLGSGAIEHASDIIIIMWVPEKHQHEKFADINLHIAKQRDGPTGWVHAEFIKPQLLIRDKDRPRKLHYLPPQTSMDFQETEHDDADYHAPF